MTGHRGVEPMNAFRAKGAAVLGAGIVLSLLALPGSVGAVPSPCPLGLTISSTQHPPGGVPFVICSGRITTFDGTPLDVDLSLRVEKPTRRPLMVMLHGWGGDKTNWESATLGADGRDRYHWNNAWFVSQGFAVLNYTARGFHRSCGKDPASGYSYTTDPECLGHPGQASWTHLADRRWEVRDTQYLVGLLVDTGIAKPRRVVATGGSYGGGQSWLLAMSNGRVMRVDGSTVPWESPKGVAIRLAAAIPKYPWTDLAQALTDNGRGAGPHEDPIGVEKKSYVDGLYALGQTTAQYAVNDPAADLNGWYAGLSAGEPYESNPQVGEALNQINGYRSPFYMRIPQIRVPVFAIQGVTDPLFPGVQALQMAKRLEDSGYPVWTLLGDLGHSYAGNPSNVWHLANTTANRWLSEVMAGQSPSAAKYTVANVRCVSGQVWQVHRARRFGQLPTRVVLGSWKESRATESSSPPGPEAAAADPIANAGCRSLPEQTDPGVAAWSRTVDRSFTLMGSPVVTTKIQLQGVNAEVAARLWDVDPATGNQTLVTRAVYRLVSESPSSARTLVFALWPMAWQFQVGHRLKLELTQVDAPTWRPDNLPSTITFQGAQLRLPAR
jgi:pimeloyl-ACP methyl ester carboxylesterase